MIGGIDNAVDSICSEPGNGICPASSFGVARSRTSTGVSCTGDTCISSLSRTYSPPTMAMRGRLSVEFPGRANCNTDGSVSDSSLTLTQSVIGGDNDPFIAGVGKVAVLWATLGDKRIESLIVEVLGNGVRGSVLPSDDGDEDRDVEEGEVRRKVDAVEWDLSRGLVAVGGGLAGGGGSFRSG